MAPTEFHEALRTLGLAQQRVAALFGVGPRSVRRWQYGDRRVPCGVGIVLRLLQTGAVTIEAVEQAAVPFSARTNGGVEPEPPVVEPPSEHTLVEPALEQVALAGAQPVALVDLPLSARTNAEPVEARREKAKELVDAGMSVRATAKALGVSKSTVQRDVSQTDSVLKLDKAQTKAERRAERELDLAAKLPTKRYDLIVAAPQPPSEATTDLGEPSAPLPLEAGPSADPEIAPDSILTSTAEKVASLTSRSCHWPIGDPAGPEFRFCGAAVDAPPYCPQHRVLAYLSPAEMRLLRRRRRSTRGIAYTSTGATAWAG
jgi:GcrA cell cycle regulator